MPRHHLSIAAIAFALSAVPAFAQQQPARQDCVTQASTGQPGQPSQASAKEPATAPDHGGGTSGTSPGSAGSTGWTGGTGGSYVGTVPSGPNSASPSQHPEVATGLDPMKSVSKLQGCQG